MGGVTAAAANAFWDAIVDGKPAASRKADEDMLRKRKQLVVSARGCQGSTSASRSSSVFEKRRRCAPSRDLRMEFTQQKTLKSLSNNFSESVGRYAVFFMRTAIHQPPIFDCGLGIEPPTRCQRGQLWPMAERYRTPHTAITTKETGAERPRG